MPDEDTPEAIELERVERAAAKLHKANEAFDAALKQGADPAEIPIAPSDMRDST